ncbi:MAG: peptidoglycan editing factor PgeF [Rhizobiaceae bacterium]
MLSQLSPDPLLCNQLTALKGVSHGFFSRSGGVSRGIYRGLNAGLGSDDDAGHVAENRRRIASVLSVKSDWLVGPHQVHSADVVIIDRPFEGGRPKADGIVTSTPGLAIGVLTADCGPVLFADGEARVVAAAHAGWKGALAGVLENTIAAMEELGARRERILATLGPLISQRNYEVGPEFVDRFATDSPEDSIWFVPSKRSGHAMFDLQGFVVQRLQNAGVRTSALDVCTYADEELFYSYRRTTHRNEPDYGRQMSAISLEAT